MNKIVINLIIVCVLVQLLPIDAAKREVTRKKRSFFEFPRNAALGIIVAIAVPLDLPKRNVFMSYNIEGNYNHATATTDIIPGVLQRLDLLYNERGFRDSKTEGNLISGNSSSSSSSGEAMQHYQQGENLMNRRKIYKILEHQLTNYGFNGTQCLLRSICEAAEMPLGEHNGIFGDLFHVTFTPSSSQQENLDQIYYDAEQQGKEVGCKQYHDNCPRNLFDYITKVL